MDWTKQEIDLMLVRVFACTRQNQWVNIFQKLGHGDSLQPGLSVKAVQLQPRGESACRRMLWGLAGGRPKYDSWANPWRRAFCGAGGFAGVLGNAHALTIGEQEFLKMVISIHKKRPAEFQSSEPIGFAEAAKIMNRPPNLVRAEMEVLRNPLGVCRGTGFGL